jgi:hypothetical protein
MKKILIYIVFVFIILSCDTIGYDKFLVINNCNDEIAVSVIRFNYESDTINFIIKTKNEHLFHQSEGVPAKVSNIIELEFKQITIIKNGKVSQVNYIDKTKWKYVDVDDTHSEWYLTVNPEDFETK